MSAYKKFTSIESHPNMDFEIGILDKNGSITGYHCAIADDGNKIDCADENTVSFKGNEHGNIFHVDVKSQFSNAEGKAEIYYLTADTLLWILKAKPAEEYYLPDTSILVKVR
ncbi:MAG: hypothetical protein SFW35_08040 [Chitinophagales bacterium]|nr:hypothetical protein [Chitinophagales bacterium]